MNLHHYTLERKEFIQEVDGEVSLYTHNETKAKVMLINNHNPNKTFAIGFRTPPTDSTGVAHIVEHSVLSGSRKYHTKEPFMDLVASSLQTFLNAMTYPDKTIYPVSSRNDRDFVNLMDLYLDAVFFPSMKEKKEIFLQEGWHREIREDRLLYNGVVYNEMKGVYSDPANIASDMTSQALHPTGTYSHDSGGNPENIPDLTYEAFIKFHDRYYHPSNSYIFLAGEMDFVEKLNYLHEEYLSHFEYLEIDSQIIMNEPFTEPKSFKQTYPISKEEYGKDKSFLALAWNMSDKPDLLDPLLRAFFAEYLINSDNAILKTRLLSAGIGEDVYVETPTLQSLDFQIMVYHGREENFDKFKEITFDTLEELAREGFSEDNLRSTLRKFEYSIRRGKGAHRDLMCYIQALGLWLYEDDPIDALKLDEYVKMLEDLIGSDFFTDKIREYFLENPNRVEGVILPEIGKKERENKILEEKLVRELATLSETEVDLIVREQENLITFQETEDSPEAKSTIPTLSLEDVAGEIPKIAREIRDVKGITALFSRQPSNGLLHFQIAHSMDHLTLEEMKYASLLTDLLGKVETERKSIDELDRIVYLETGGFSFTTPIVNQIHSRDYRPLFTSNFVTMIETLDQAVSLYLEIIHETLFNNENRIREIINATKSNIESSLLLQGHTTVANIVRSYSRKSSYIDEEINGLAYYYFLSDLIQKDDPTSLRQNLISVYKKLFRRDNLTLQFIGEEENFSRAEEALSKIVGKLIECPGRVEIAFQPEAKNMAYSSSSQVNFVSKGYDIRLLGEEYRGDMTVLSNLLSTKYLHNNIRAKGGAYGAGINIRLSGELATYSYRDPNLKNTLDVYDKMGEYLRNLKINKEELDTIIIGSMNAFDPHMDPIDLAKTDFTRFLSGMEFEDLMRWKKEALETTVENLQKYGDLLDRVMERNFLAVIGNEKMIEENQEKFKTIQNLRR